MGSRPPSRSKRVVPGDVVLLSAGSLIQAVLTGETYPAEKRPGANPASASLAERTNTAFLGTSVRSGTARALVTETGPRTAFGQIAGKLTLRPPETGFEQGIRNFGYLLAKVTIVRVFSVFAIALAVGLAPELLPAILSITLSRGAQRMAERGEIGCRLNATENFGSMDILCTDKTATLTLGVVKLDGALGADGSPAWRTQWTKPFSRLACRRPASPRPMRSPMTSRGSG